jgi:hypothetical protein
VVASSSFATVSVGAEPGWAVTWGHLGPTSGKLVGLVATVTKIVVYSVENMFETLIVTSHP